MNKLSRKTKIILGLLLVSVGSIIYLGVNLKKPAPTENTPLPEVTVPQISVANIQLEMPNNLQINIPDSLKVYAVNNPSLSSVVASQIATGLGFTGTSQFINDPIYGPTTIWSSPEKSLIIKNRDRIITLGSNKDLSQLPTGFKLNSEEILERARDYIQQLPLSQFKFETREVKYFKINGLESSNETSSIQANTAKVYFTYTIDKLPLISPVLSQIFPTITFDRNGNILDFDLTLPPSLNESNSRNTLTVAELKQKLPTAKLITFSNTESYDPLSDYFKDKAVVTKVYLAYYQYLQQITYQPVFIIEVEGQTKSGKNTTASFVLPALK